MKDFIVGAGIGQADSVVAHQHRHDGVPQIQVDLDRLDVELRCSHARYLLRFFSLDYYAVMSAHQLYLLVLPAAVLDSHDEPFGADYFECDFDRFGLEIGLGAVEQLEAVALELWAAFRQFWKVVVEEGVDGHEFGRSFHR